MSQPPAAGATRAAMPPDPEGAPTPAGVQEDLATVTQGVSR